MSSLQDRREASKNSGATLCKDQSVASSATLYRRVRVAEGRLVGLHLQWNDGTTNGTFKVYTSGHPDPTEPATSGSVDASMWKEETGLSITGPAASAAGCDVVHVGVNGAPWLMVSFAATATSDISIYAHCKE